MNVKSPDEVLLISMTALMKWCLGMFGIKPPALIFYPALAVAAVGCLANFDIMMRIDATYLFQTLISGAWVFFLWKGGKYLRGDAKKEWNVEMHRKYAASASWFRDGKAPVRYGLLVCSVVVTVMVLRSTDADIAALAPWHRMTMASFIWSVAFFAYIKSAEPPLPDDGDRYFKPRAA